MRIDLAAVGDLKAIQRLYRQLYAFTAQLQPEFYQDAPQEEAFLKQVLADPNSAFLVARDGAQVVGFALVQEQETLRYPCIVRRRMAHLMDLCVQEDRRGQGVGKMLLQVASGWASARGCDGIELAVLAENQAARRLYQAHGYRERMLTLYQPLK
ncbi:MAG: GNAT family N-acetyltransferase [Anaerotruncus sp.]|nr:GNAT family N-acetyltransferase [Anaerotruncus sp.]